jgi:hypothetical protein
MTVKAAVGAFTAATAAFFELYIRNPYYQDISLS